MQLKYGSYAFDVNATLVTTQLEMLKNKGGQPYASKQTLEVKGFLSATEGTLDPQADLSLKMNEMANALAVWGNDLILYNDDGTISGSNLRDSSSITGVRIIKGPSFPTAEGPEYAAIRTFEFTAEAEYPLPGSSLLLLDFQETLTFWGGGPFYAHRRAINGPPQKQLIWPMTEYHCTQTGFSVGYRDYPAVSPPKFPFALKEAPKFTRKSPERKGQGYEGFEVTWEYQFESVGSLNANPTFWVN